MTPERAGAAAAVQKRYAVCRDASGAVRAFRVRKTYKIPRRWETVAELGDWEAARKAVAELVAQRDARRSEETAAANAHIRSVLGKGVFAGRMFQVTETELREQGLLAFLGRKLKLSPAQARYLAWVDAGRPPL